MFRKKLIKMIMPAIVFMLWFTACDVGIDAEHRISEELFDDPEFIGILVGGAFGDFAYATAQATGGIYHASALLTDELLHIGSFSGFNALSRGLSRRTDTEMRTFWAQTSRARWQAESVVGRFEEQFDSPEEDGRYALVLLLAGHANRVIADFFDFTVVDGGPQMTREEGYQRAIEFLERAVAAAEVSGEEDYRLAAIGGIAHSYAMLGNWTEVEEYASQIPIDFVFEQIHSRNSAREENAYGWWAHDRGESGVWGTPFEEWGTMVDATGNVVREGDPRVVYDDPGMGGFTLTNVPRYRQKKFHDEDNIPIVKGTEMRLLEAEARLQQAGAGGISEAMGFINEVRAHHGIDALSDPGTINEAWDVYMRERGIELWLEGKRLADLRRWADSPGQEFVNIEVVRIRSNEEGFVSDPEFHSVYQNAEGILIEEFSLMVSDREFDTNPNL